MDDTVLRLHLLEVCGNAGAARAAYAFIQEAVTAGDAQVRLSIIEACPHDDIGDNWAGALSFVEGRDA